MAEPRKYTEEEAYGMLQTAMLTGQDALDSLPKEVKRMALTAAERSLGDGPSDIGAEDAEGYTPVPGMTPYGLTDEARKEIDVQEQEAGRGEYKLTEEELSSPDREGFTPVVSPPREEYKGFMAPSGMSAEQIAAWKEGIDDRLLDKPERVKERIEGEHPKEQLKDLLRRASEGDMEAIKDIGYFGLNVASMSPVGQLGQAAADVGVGTMDLAEGDYTGAAISGAAVVLPISAVAMKKLMKHNSTQVKLVEDALQKGDISEEQFNKEIRELIPNQGPMRNEDYDEIVKVLSQKPSGDMSDLEKMLRQGFDPETFKIRGRNITNVKDRELLRQFRDELAAEGNKNLQRNPDKYYYTGKEAVDANLDEYDYLLDNSRKTAKLYDKRAEVLKASGGKETPESLELKEIADWQQYSFDPPSPRIQSLIEKHGTAAKDG
tara:strand:- start:4020 stop:5321 length:1302 start_codon:yes stop_codon:yes gene_type:complete